MFIILAFSLRWCVIGSASLCRQLAVALFSFDVVHCASDPMRYPSASSFVPQSHSFGSPVLRPAATPASNPVPALNSNPGIEEFALPAPLAAATVPLPTGFRAPSFSRHGGGDAFIFELLLFHSATRPPLSRSIVKQDTAPLSSALAAPAIPQFGHSASLLALAASPAASPAASAEAASKAAAQTSSSASPLVGGGSLFVRHARTLTPTATACVHELLLV